MMKPEFRATVSGSICALVLFLASLHPGAAVANSSTSLTNLCRVEENPDPVDDIEAAERQCDALIRKRGLDDQTLVRAYNNRCWIRIRRRAADEALRDCALAISLRPDFVPAYVNRGRTWSMRGRAAEA
ncbi:MAG: hypothetical protein H8D70_00535, partial [Rhodospirillaceae bacterium]|nr:hypothetical protein [Rhodospirillaceae bacterium]